jgi:anti-sigma factor RsiW
LPTSWSEGCSVKTCERFRPLLSRFAEGETEPREALGVARHLAGCTACKIVLARERRLHEALDGLGDPVSADEEFSRLVMAALPAGPPPSAPGTRRRGLRLAGLLGLGSLGGAIAFRILSVGSCPEPLKIASRLDLEGGSYLLSSIGRIAGAAAAMLARIVTGLPACLHAENGGVHMGLPPLLAAAAALTAGAFLVILTWVIGRRPRVSRSVEPSDEERLANPRH